ncbi:MAG: GAF domain-containing sensor histidine kinase [Spirochaetes bacterium]|nr:GAF domain-containing sensor histidine kinase [Spirochaetota bacterium]
MRAEHSKKERDILDSIEDAVAGVHVLEEVVDAIVPRAQGALPFERLDVMLLEEGGHRLMVRCARAGYKPLAMEEGVSADVRGGIFERATLGESVVIDDISVPDEESAGDVPRELLVKEGVRSILVVPVVAGEAIGLLACSSRKPASFSKRHAAFLLAVAKMLRNQVEREIQAIRVERNYREYMEMLGFVSHEMKSPVSSIITLVRTLADGYYGKLEDNQRGILERVVNKAEYLYAISNQYLNLSRIESGMMALKPRLVDFVDDVIQPVIELLAPQIESREMRLEREYDDTVFPVRCDPDLVRIVMINLLGNGVKYGNRGGVIRITLDKGFKMFSVSVWNEGPGFDEKEKTMLFKKFTRLGDPVLAERRGSGIGLYVSWKVAQLHSGRIYAESEKGSWARFTLELPQYMDLCIVT